MLVLTLITLLLALVVLTGRRTEGPWPSRVGRRGALVGAVVCPSFPSFLVAAAS